MNPATALALIIILGNKGVKGLPPTPAFPALGKLRLPMGPNYIDTFKIEMMLDRLHAVTNTLEQVNHLHQIQKLPPSKVPSIDRIQDSLNSVKTFLADGKTSRKVDNLSNTISGVKKLGNMEEIINTLGPVLSALSNSDEK
jgi:hypothetical protein